MPDGGRAARLARWTALLWSLLSFPASAELPPQITIEWAGSPLCPRSLGLDAEILRLLGDRRTEGEPTRFVARVDELADRSVNYYRLSLSVSSESRRADRSVELATCTDVQDAAALLIASAIDPDAITRAKPPPPPPPPPPPQPEPEPVSKDETAAPLFPVRWSLRAQAQLDKFSLPGVTAGPVGGALLQYGHYRAWLDAQYLFPRTAEARGDILRTQVRLFTGTLGGAYVWRFDDFVLGPALGAELGRMRTRSKVPRGDAPVVRPADDDSTLWGGFLFGAVAAYAVDRWVGVEAGLFASVPVQHPELQIDGGGKPFYTTQPIAMRLALGLRVSLGSP